MRVRPLSGFGVLLAALVSCVGSTPTPATPVRAGTGPATAAPAPAPVPASASAGAVEPPASGVIPTDDQENVCATIPCRPEITFRVSDETTTYVVKVPPTPYAGSDALSVYPGDDYFVTAEEIGGLLRNFRYVDPPRQPQNVLHVQFAQEKKNGRFIMVLTIQSFYSRRLVYHALSNHPARPQRELVKTSTCPLGPMMRSIELWPTPISFLKLTDFRFREGKQVCEYY